MRQHFLEVDCPVCEGTGRIPAPSFFSNYAKEKGWYGYSKEDDRCHCNNCGGQTMMGYGTGKTWPRKDDNKPCVHEFTGQSMGRCYVRYNCKHCGYSYDIDSSD